MSIFLDADGDVGKLSADLNMDAVLRFMEETRRDVYDYGNGVDTKDPNLGVASGRAIGFRYTDLDSDCQAIAAEMQRAFERAKIFIDAYFGLAGKGDFAGEEFTITFNMDMPVNEAEVIGTLTTLAGGRTIISRKTLVNQLPYIKDTEQEIKQIEEEETEAAQQSGPAFGARADPNAGDDE